MEQAMTRETLLTSKEMRAELRLSRSAFYEAVARGEIPALRIGRCLRFDRKAVLASLQTKAAKPKTGQSHRARWPAWALQPVSPAERPAP